MIIQYAHSGVAMSLIVFPSRFFPDIHRAIDDLSIADVDLLKMHRLVRKVENVYFQSQKEVSLEFCRLLKNLRECAQVHQFDLQNSAIPGLVYRCFYEMFPKDIPEQLLCSFPLHSESNIPLFS